MPNQVIVTHPSIETIIVSAKGVRGEQGVGIPEGGEEGQIIVKKSELPFDTEWRDLVLSGEDVPYNPEFTGLLATNMQEVVDLVNAKVDEVGLSVEEVETGFEGVVTGFEELKGEVENVSLVSNAILQTLGLHIADFDNPHRVNATQVGFTSTGDLLTASTVHGALTELEQLVGLGNEGQFIGVLNIDLVPTPPLPSTDGLNLGDYFVIQALAPKLWQGFADVKAGDLLLLGDNRLWYLLHRSVNETDPVFRASPAFTISENMKHTWTQGFDKSVRSLVLDGDTNILSLSKEDGTVINVDLTKYDNEAAVGSALLEGGNTFNGDQVINGEVTADEFRGSGANLINVLPRTINDNQDSLRPIVCTYFTLPSSLSTLLTQNHVMINTELGELHANRFVGDGSGLVDIVENVEIGVY